MTNDEIRDLILRTLYDTHRADRGRTGGAKSIREIQQLVRPHGLKQQDVGHNLDYLVQKGWIKEVVRQRNFTTNRGTTQSAEQVTFKISDAGIDRIEQASTYQRSPVGGSINITNIQGVTVVGNDNVVNTSFTELSRQLMDARQVVLASPAVADAAKLEIVADIDTLQSQLQRPMPHAGVVRQVWTSLENALTAAGLIELGAKIAALVAPLLV